MSNNSSQAAYWTQKTHLFSPDEFICSYCGYSYDKAYDTCPHCGSDMVARGKYDASWVDEAEIMDIILGD